MRKRQPRELKVPEKANRILNGVLVVLVLIAFRIWHLAVVQHEEKLENSRKPQTRVVVEKAERAPIVDRKGTLLAVNKVQYNASILYGPIRQLPRTVWKKDERGKKVKSFYRKEYITKLSELLAKELHLDQERIEDLVHSRAAVLGNVPCLLKENITEAQYFRLKMLEKDWPGIHGEISAKRWYPLGAIGAEVIGFLGPISRNEYEKVTQEMMKLRQILTDLEEGENPVFPKEYPTFEEVSTRLEELEKKAYSLNDLVGKAGVEASFDHKLRGISGKHVYLSDIKGNYLKELENSQSPASGEKIVLTLSAELQEYTEKLLAECEASQSQRSGAVRLRSLVPPNQPWIKGGAIVALSPKTGEVYALASFPRFDPNDFMLTKDLEESLEKRNKIHRWLEDERNIANIWDFKMRFERERFSFSKGVFYTESKEMSWENFLGFILPANSSLLRILKEKNKLKEAIFIQRKIEELIQIFQSNAFQITPAKIFDVLYQNERDVATGVMITLQERDFLASRYQEKKNEVEDICFDLSPFFKSLSLNYEKLLLVDLYRLSVEEKEFTPALLEAFSDLTIGTYREFSGRVSPVEAALKKIIEDHFSELDFKKWREESFKEYLAEMRKIEKKEKKRIRPFIEYLDMKKEEMFAKFWEENRWLFLTTFFTHAFDPSKTELKAYFEILQNWQRELKEGAHQALFWTPHYLGVKQLIEGMEPHLVLALLKTTRFFDDLEKPLYGVYSGLRGKLEKHLACAFYPRYGFGFARSHAFRQSSIIGSIFKLVCAYEALKQRYIFLKEHQESTKDLNPLTIVDDKHKTGVKDGWNVGYTLDGKPIPMFYRGGRLPRSEHFNVGRVDLLHAIEASSNPYFAMLAGDVIEDPEDLTVAANLLGYGEKTEIDLPGEYAGRLPKDIAYNRTGLYAMAIGQHSLVGTPLQTALMLASFANGGEVLKPQIALKKEAKIEVRWRIFLPLPIQNLLLTGMKKVITGEKGTARILKSLYSTDFTNRLIGKTSTAESIEMFGLDGNSGKLKVKQIWFGAVAYETSDFTKPELVVVVYLRHGEFGRDAAPIAAKVIQKWREIEKKKI